MKVLLIDIGNTFGKLITYNYETSTYSAIIRTTNVGEQVEEILSNLKSVSLVLVSSTVPKSYEDVRTAASKFDKVETIKLDHNIILKRLRTFSVAYDVNKLGSDRLIAAAGAFIFLNDSKRNAESFEASIVVDAGTAVNVEVILRDKGYIGGSISPGFRLMREVLCSGTAQLPLGDVGAEMHAPKSVGTCTLECIASGVFSSVCGGVYDIVSRICRHGPLKDLDRVCVIITGGDCDCLLKHLKGDLENNISNVRLVTSQPLYILKSMRTIFEMSASS